MINRVTHAFVLVTDQDVALDFYVTTLGFELKTDMVLDEYGMRWLSVSPPGQPDFELVLDLVRDERGVGGSAAGIGDLVAAGTMPTVIFAVDDCQAVHDALVAKGVDFYDPPTDRFYGIDAGFRDPFGNPFRMTQAKAV